MEDIDAVRVSWMDYISFILMLTVSAVIGIYFGIYRKKPNTVEEYMFGGRKMHSIPVCLSIVASCISNISLVVWPLETYYYGGTIFFMAFGDLTASVLIYFFYLPVFYHLQYTSLFEYLERRFNRICRKIVSAVYIETQIFYMMVIMYTSCKAITQVIMIPYYIFTPSICLICTVYTCLGGIRGVIWTDFIQSLFMFVSVILIIILGTQTFDNGIADVFAISSKGGRLDIFSFRLNPFVRDSAWIEYLAVMVISILVAGTNPGVMQRYLSLPSFSKAKMVLIIYAIIGFLMISLSIFLGLLIYAYYHDCDPSMSQALTDKNQLVIYYISDVLKDVPGLTGLFLAGILSAALSSMSTIMNACSGIMFEDLVKPALPWELTNTQNSLGIKYIVVAFGIIITIGIFFLNAEGGIFQVGRTKLSLTCGAIVFIFSFGIFFKRGSTKGVIAGALAGLVLTLWIGIGSQAAVSSGRIRYSTKILSVEGCPGNVTEKLGLNATISGSSDYNAPVIFADDVPYLYRISFNLIAPMGIIVSIAVAFLVSLITSNDRVVEEKLLIPQIRKNHRNRTPNCDYVQCEEMILTNTE